MEFLLIFSPTVAISVIFAIYIEYSNVLFGLLAIFVIFSLKPTLCKADSCGHSVGPRS